MLGVLPLALTTGAGSGGQNAIGTGVIGGTFSATFFGILFIPLFFVAVLRLFRVKPRSIAENPGESPVT
jgi:multidrug efflux pump